MIQEFVGNFFIGVGVLFALVGFIGVFRFNNFYAKLLAISKIDTMAILTVLIGVAIRSGFTFFTLKVALIFFLIIIVNPIVTSRIALSKREDELNQNEEEFELSD